MGYAVNVFLSMSNYWDMRKIVSRLEKQNRWITVLLFAQTYSALFDSCDARKRTQANTHHAYVIRKLELRPHIASPQLSAESVTFNYTNYISARLWLYVCMYTF